MRKLIGITLFLSAAAVHGAGAPVEELGPDFSSYPQQAPAPERAVSTAAPSNQAAIDLHYELQSLREEVRQLRGIVEEQSNELRQLKQRQMDDYQDLDRRLGGEGGGAPAAPVAVQQRQDYEESASGQMADDAAQPLPQLQEGELPGSAAAQDSAMDDQGEYESYTQTYNLLKARKIDEAVAGFKNLVAKYPAGKYTANSYYWLGEIYLLQNNLPEAEKSFGTVTVNFPAHRKAPDAMFKLAKVYHLQGQNEKAKVLLDKVAGGSSSAASLAKAYLNENF